MGDLSQHFSKKDFACKCGQCGEEQYRIHLGLVGALEAIGGRFRRPVKIVLGYLCEKEGSRVGKSIKSVHRQGRAAHIQMDNVEIPALFKMIKMLPEIRGIGLNFEEKYIHVDTRREDPAEWVKEGGREIALTDSLRSRHALT